MPLTLDSIRDIKLYQSREGYRFSVDALLLYSFVNLQHVRKIADLGAGSGVVGLLLARKYPKAEVALIELQKSLCELSEKNIRLNDLQERVKAVRMDIRNLTDFAGARSPYDLVVSNPPFRTPISGRISIDEERAVARHELKLKLPELIKAAGFLLKPKGRLCLVYLPERLPELIVELRRACLEPKRLRLVHSKIDTEAKMLLIEAVKDGRPGMEIELPLFVYNDDGTYKEEMLKLFRAEN